MIPHAPKSHPQVLSAAGIVAATVVYGVIDASLQQRLHDHYVLDSASAGSYAEWLDQDAPGAPVIYADFYVYHINNVRAPARERRTGRREQYKYPHAVPSIRPVRSLGTWRTTARSRT